METGPVAQRIRARGYEPRCRGFESLLAHNRPRGKGTSPLGVGKYRDSGPKAMELGCGSFVEIECFFLFLVNEGIITHSMPGPFSLFFCFTSLNSSSAGLGQNSGASTTNCITKKNAFLVINMFARGNCDLSGGSMTASKMQC